jgi:hypothetical protein
MILESAEVLANGGKIVDAVKTLIVIPRAPDRTRRALEYLSTGLWERQSFGMDHPTTDAEVVSELLTLADALINDMREPEAQEVCLLFSHVITLTLRKYSSQCSGRGTKLISKDFAFCIASSPGQKITPLLYCALIPPLPPLSLCKALLRSILDPNFPSIPPTSSFWIA